MESGREKEEQREMEVERVERRQSETFGEGKDGRVARSMEKKLKLVVVGDSYVGKTSLLFAYTEKKFLGNYSTTVFDNWALTVNIENKTYTVNLFDTAGQEDYVHLRSLSYPHTDVFLLCFALDERKSLDACRTVWMPEIRKNVGENVPVVLVGTKEDLMENANDKEKVPLDLAKKTAAELGCAKFIACSALTHRNLKRVFDEAFLAATGVDIKDPEEKVCCSIL